MAAGAGGRPGIGRGQRPVFPVDRKRGKYERDHGVMQQEQALVTLFEAIRAIAHFFRMPMQRIGGLGGRSSLPRLLVRGSGQARH